MSEYVRIESSPAEIIGIANSLSAAGRNLASRAGNLAAEIRGQETRGETFPSDQFTDAFTPQYYQAVQTSADGTSPANEAITDSARLCGEKLDQIGLTVSQSMVTYVVTDEDSGDGIARTV